MSKPKVWMEPITEKDRMMGFASDIARRNRVGAEMWDAARGPYSIVLTPEAAHAIATRIDWLENKVRRLTEMGARDE